VSVQAASVLILALMFVVATARDVNMGVLGFVAAFLLGTVFLHLDVSAVWQGFPVDVFVMLVGLTYLFGFAQNNGAIEVLVRWSMWLVRGNLTLAPWIFFAMTAALVAIGALFSVAIVTPLALGFARRHRINQFMMGLLVVHGALAGAFSPISVYGVFINGFLVKQGFATSPLSLFVAPLVFSLVFAIVVYLVGGGHHTCHEIFSVANLLVGCNGPSGNGAKASIASIVRDAYVPGKYLKHLPTSYITTGHFEALREKYYDIAMFGHLHGTFV